MVDWEAAAVVAFTGIISVFAVLAVLQIAVQISGSIINSQMKKKQKQKA
ncbi:OadG family transporter subunit [Desulfotruncus alcoholivorax]|nr:OadG family transporter subunit [Desulfotruncus alcoholivorax]